jgi:hypothetical protein
LINSLLTIIIPCKDSLYELKITIESIVKQFKIRGTRVLILDLKSEDGSYQYADQASFEYFNKIKIELIKINSDLNLTEFIKEIKTPYFLIITPGSIIKDKELIFNSVNRLSQNKIPNVYIKKYPILRRFFPLDNIKKGKIEINAIISEKKFLYEIEFNSNILIIPKDKINRNSILIKGEL